MRSTPPASSPASAAARRRASSATRRPAGPWSASHRRRSGSRSSPGRAGRSRIGGESEFVEIGETAEPPVPFDEEAIAAALADEARGRRHFPDYRVREEQIRLARRFVRNLADDESLLLEGGTGVGKSLAYLAAAIPFAVERAAAGEGSPLVISTRTKLLQDQLLDSDIAAAARFLGEPGLRAVSIKGRANYVCARRLALALAEGSEQSIFPEDRLAYAVLETCAKIRPHGEIGSVPAALLAPLPGAAGAAAPRRGGPGGAVLAGAVRHPGGLSPGPPPRRARPCGSDRRKPRSGAALAPGLPPPRARDRGRGPRARSGGGRSLRAGSVPRGGPGALRRGLRAPGGREEEAPGFPALRPRSPGSWSRTPGRGGGSSHRSSSRWDARSADGAGDFGEVQIPEPRGPSLAAAASIAGSVADRLDEVADAADEGVRAEGNAAALDRNLGDLRAAAEALRLAFEEGHPEAVAGFEGVLPPFDRWRLVVRQVSPADSFHAQFVDGLRSFAGVSASLFVGGDAFAALGDLEIEARAGERLQRDSVPSPFPYAEHMRVVALEGGADLVDETTEVLESLARQLGGRTLGLFTSLRRMYEVSDELSARLREEGIDVLAPRRASDDPGALVARFVHGAAVLLGARKFWQGIDIPGDRLQAVVIEKLPFEVPTELRKRRERRLESQGVAAFQRCTLGRMLLNLKQMSGRLIRTEEDRGIVVIVEGRTDKSYFRRLEQALPPGNRVIVATIGDLSGILAEVGIGD